MNSRSSNHHYSKIKSTRNLMIGAIVVGLLGCAWTAGSSRSYATIQGKSQSSYHHTYFVMGNRAVVTMIFAGVSVGIGLGVPLTVQLYNNVVSRSK